MPPKVTTFTDNEINGLNLINWEGYFDINFQGTHGIVLPKNPAEHNIQDTMYLLAPYMKLLISEIRYTSWTEYNIPRWYTFMRTNLPIPEAELCDLMLRGNLRQFHEGLRLRNNNFRIHYQQLRAA